MPKLDASHTTTRRLKRIEELEQGVEVSAKDFRAVLTAEQYRSYETAWAVQQSLRKGKRARSKAEEKQLGWKSKREIRIEILKAALLGAEDNEIAVWQKKSMQADLRQMRIYFDSIDDSLAQGKPIEVAQSIANNNLTRAGLRRMDNQVVGFQSTRDREVWAMEEQIKAQMWSMLDDEKLEQVAWEQGLELSELKKHIKSVLKNKEKNGEFLVRT